MLLRSVTKHVKAQNWFAVVLDLVIVIIGVFIGIQVSNWNEQRAGEEKAQVLIQRLYDDLNNDYEALTAALNYHAVVRNYAITAIDGFNNVESVSDEQFVIAAYQASQISEPWGYRSTYNELLSTGHFDLIKSDELKSLILGYYSVDWTKQTILTTMAPYREQIRSIMPFLIQDTIRSECGDVVVEIAKTFGTVLPASCDLQLPDELFRETAATLRSKTDMLGSLRYQVSVYEAQVSTLTNFRVDSRKLTAAIDNLQWR